MREKDVCEELCVTKLCVKVRKELCLTKIVLSKCERVVRDKCDS